MARSNGMAQSSKNIIITGAGGMIGPMLAKRLLDDDHKLFLTDLVQPKIPEGVALPENAKGFKGDICDPAFVKTLIEAAQPLDAIFIFHGIMSAGSEANFDLVSPWHRSYDRSRDTTADTGSI
jgi:nucleoside-diphosphate-sugar epimerase